MTPAEIRAFNAGIFAMVDIARRSADAIRATSRRPLVEGFAIAALEALATDGLQLMIRPGDAASVATSPIDPTEPSTSATLAAAE